MLHYSVRFCRLSRRRRVRATKQTEFKSPFLNRIIAYFCCKNQTNLSQDVDKVTSASLGESLCCAASMLRLGLSLAASCRNCNLAGTNTREPSRSAISKHLHLYRPLKKILFRQAVCVFFWETQDYRMLKESLIFCLK